MKFPQQLKQKLEQRKLVGTHRSLKVYPKGLIDFHSNDYLGLASHPFEYQSKDLTGATGSRLISGNHLYYQELENSLSQFYRAESSLLFPSGYMANIGFFGAVPKKGDVIFYDELVHASLREGMRLNRAEAIGFSHQNLEELDELLSKTKTKGEKYVVVETVYSMDGDLTDTSTLIEICEKHKAFLIVDEAHSVGVFGKQGEGITAHIESEYLLARILPFGKALGGYGAVIVGSRILKEYLVNFSRSLIYTTALPKYQLKHIELQHQSVKKAHEKRQKLKENIQFFRDEVKKRNLSPSFLDSETAIQAYLNAPEVLLEIEKELFEKKMAVRTIVSPTVERGKERIRIILHSFNTQEQIEALLEVIFKKDSSDS